ncbi:unnamed protein product [Symbiodinium sp. CCMP2592]|nr:unnamed protein product [Symbiodinium sp. CCMP2592]
MSLSEAQRLMISAYLQSAEQGKLVQTVDALHDYLLQEGLAWKQVLRCDCIGVHEENRDGLGLSAGHVADLVSNISSIGFSAAEFRGVAIEIPPTAEGEALRSFNRKVTEESNGRLAPANNLRFASIVGSHANQAARCFWFQVPHSDDKLTVDNRLSLEKLKVVDASWHRAIMEGMQWLIISHAVPAEFQQYTGLAQAAGNSAMQIASAEGEVQLARKVNVAMAKFLKRTSKSTVNYGDISQEILRSKPPNASCLPHIFSFVLKCGGGSGEESFLSRTERYVRASGRSNRALGGDIWHALSQDCKGSEQHVPFRHMLIKLGLCGPEKAITLTDCKRALSAKEVLANVGKAEAVLVEVQRLLQGIANVESVLGDLEVELAAIVLQKKKIAKHESIEDAAGTFLEKCGWSWLVAGSVYAWTLRLYDDTGKLLSNSRVVDLGFQPGKEVIRKADDVKGTIIEITADKVRLKLTNGKEYEASSQSFVDNKWKIFVPKVDPVLFKEWTKYGPLRSEEFVISVIKGLAYRCMYDQYESLKVDDLDVFLKPSKDVQVKKSYNTNILKLPIATARVHVGETVPAGAVQLAVLAAGASSKVTQVMSMQGYFQGPKTDSSQGFINPVWLMKSTTDRNEANMELHWTSKAASSQKLTCKSASMVLPIVRNFVKLDAGDSLVLWRPEMGKTETIETLQPVTKKARK